MGLTWTLVWVSEQLEASCDLWGVLCTARVRGNWQHAVSSFSVFESYNNDRQMYVLVTAVCRGRWWFLPDGDTCVWAEESRGRNECLHCLQSHHTGSFTSFVLTEWSHVFNRYSLLFSTYCSQFTAVQAWRTCPLWELSPSQSILV